MTLVYAKAFLERLENSPVLQARVESVNWDTHAMADMAAEYNHTTTATDIQTALDEKFGTLTEEQLISVAGAGGNGGGNGNGRPDPGGPVDPDKYGPPPTQSGFHDGSGWAPPPGDVSGNSCFFSGA